MLKLATVLQLIGLAGLPIGGALVANAGGGVVGASVSMLYLGASIDRGGR